MDQKKGYLQLKSFSRYEMFITSLKRATNTPHQRLSLQPQPKALPKTTYLTSSFAISLFLDVIRTHAAKAMEKRIG